MVIAEGTRDWSIRLAGLRSLIRAQPQGPVWLWMIRIRILNYLVSRYGDQPVPQAEPAAGDAETDAASGGDTLPGPGPLSLLWNAGITHPPRPLSSLRPTLEDLQTINDERREVMSPPPEVTWTWWRSTWCLRFQVQQSATRDVCP